MIFKGAIDGGFSEWSNWTACSEPQYCLQGFSKRTRTCTNPPPANGGDDCVGLSVENKDCPTQADGCTGKIQLFRERLSEKVHATILKGIAGGFEFTSTVLQRRLKE